MRPLGPARASRGMKAMASSGHGVSARGQNRPTAVCRPTKMPGTWFRRPPAQLHRRKSVNLDAAIAALSEAGAERGFTDQLQIARLKKRKLRLKDHIAVIEDALLPDIIA